jgi:hypothetical protein
MKKYLGEQGRRCVFAAVHFLCLIALGLVRLISTVSRTEFLEAVFKFAPRLCLPGTLKREGTSTI